MVTKRKGIGVLPFSVRLYNVASLVLRLAAKRDEPISLTRNYIFEQTRISLPQLSMIENATVEFPFIITRQRRILLNALFVRELGEELKQQHELN